MRKPLIIITGASSGIGEATARQLSALGYPLLLLARRIERLQALALPQTLCRQVDVTDAAALQAAVAEAEAQYGAADALINNAGVMLLGRLHEQDPAEWQRMLDVNVRGVLNGIHAVLAGMMARRHGTIINVSSIAGRKTFPDHELLSHTTSASIREGYEAWKRSMGPVLRAEDVADAIRYAYEAPQNVCIREIVLAATHQPA